MPGTCEDWLGLVNNCLYFARQICEIYQLLPHYVDFKTPGELWNPLNKAVLSKFVHRYNLVFNSLIMVW